MTTTDPTPLQERIERALVLSPYVRGQLSKIGPVMKRREAERIALAAAVLPIIAAEVRKAQADALRQAAGDLSWFGAQGNTLEHLSAWDVVQTCMKAIESIADRIEKEDQT